jgi:hypothetical protein
MDYRKLAREDFDAIVTGELTHYAVWIEVQLQDALCNFFVDDDKVRERFQRLLMRRDGLTFQHKIDITRALVECSVADAGKLQEFKKLLNRSKSSSG